jgi:hypothetical protein
MSQRRQDIVTQLKTLAKNHYASGDRFNGRYCQASAVLAETSSDPEAVLRRAQG